MRNISLERKVIVALALAWSIGWTVIIFMNFQAYRDPHSPSGPTSRRH